MLEAEPFLLTAYKGKPNANLKNVLFNLYRKCNEQAKAKTIKNNYFEEIIVTQGFNSCVFIFL